MFEVKAKERMTSGINQHSPKANLPEGSKGESRDQAAAAVGVSGRTVQDARAKIIVDTGQDFAMVPADSKERP